MLPRALPNQRIFRQSEASFLAENSIDSAFTPTPGPAPFSRACPHDSRWLFQVNRSRRCSSVAGVDLQSVSSNFKKFEYKILNILGFGEVLKKEL